MNPPRKNSPNPPSSHLPSKSPPHTIQLPPSRHHPILNHKVTVPLNPSLALQERNRLGQKLLLLGLGADLLELGQPDGFPVAGGHGVLDGFLEGGVVLGDGAGSFGGAAVPVGGVRIFFLEKGGVGKEFRAVQVR